MPSCGADYLKLKVSATRTNSRMSAVTICLSPRPTQRHPDRKLYVSRWERTSGDTLVRCEEHRRSRSVVKHARHLAPRQRRTPPPPPGHVRAAVLRRSYNPFSPSKYLLVE